MMVKVLSPVHKTGDLYFSRSVNQAMGGSMADEGLSCTLWQRCEGFSGVRQSAHPHRRNDLRRRNRRQNGPPRQNAPRPR